MTLVGAEERGTEKVCCRECGAPAAATDKVCSYCRSPVATLQCVHCFGWNATSAVHCLGCGERLGLSRVPDLSDSDVKLCPGCRGPMTGYRDQDGRLWDCAQCHAQFVEHRLLDNLLAGRQRLPAPQAIKPHPLPLSKQITYYPCPHCSELMHRRNFGGRSGIVVDVCRVHGVWFEAGELKLVLEFVESGGLSEARRLSLGLKAPLGPEEQERVARAIALSLGATPRAYPDPEAASERWGMWLEARLEEVVRLYLSWSRR